jgi:excisionase family DNA binding protein/PAS domain S-box-containing protein
MVFSMDIIHRRSARTHARIIVMDTDAETTKQLIKELGHEGYKVESVEKTSRLLEKIRNEQIDILILAVEVYDNRGYELIPLIKKINQFLPIIVTSTDDSIEMATRVREHGIFFYVIKPLDMKEIKLALKNALHRQFVTPSETSVAKKEKMFQQDFEDEILVLADASKILKLSKATVSKLAKNGEIPASRVGHKWYFIRNQLLEWLRITAAGNQRNYSTLILETMDEGVAVLDRRLKIVSCNSAYLQALDVSRDQIIGEHCYRVSHRSPVPCEESTCPVRQAFKNKRPIKFMHVNYDNDGNEHYCDVIALPIKNRRGEIKKVVEIIRDNTEIYNLNKHLNWIVGFFAQECKSTLGPVVMNISALVDEYLSKTIDVDKREEMLLSSLFSLKSMHDMIRNYIVTYKGENEKLQCEKQIIDVNSNILKPIIDELKPVLYKKGLVVEAKIKGERPVYCDPDLMKIALSNLIINAAKYCDPQAKIYCILTITDKNLEIYVSCESMDLPEDKLIDLFDRFDRSDRIGISGVDLGLHVVNMIVKMHNGIVKAESGYLVHGVPMQYDNFHSNKDNYNICSKDLKRYGRFIVMVPLGREV